jgi:hypothetical protein
VQTTLAALRCLPALAAHRDNRPRIVAADGCPAMASAIATLQSMQGSVLSLTISSKAFTASNASNSHGYWKKRSMLHHLHKYTNTPNGHGYWQERCVLHRLLLQLL